MPCCTRKHTGYVHTQTFKRQTLHNYSIILQILEGVSAGCTVQTKVSLSRALHVHEDATEIS